MEATEKFITLCDVEEKLSKYGFYGMTARKSNDGRITYKYHSISYYSIKDVSVTIAKLDKEKIVIGMTVDGQGVSSLDELSRVLDKVKQIHYNNIRNYEEHKRSTEASRDNNYNHRKRMQFRNRNARKNQTVEKTNKKLS